MLPSIFSASLLLSASTVSAQATAVEAQVAAVLNFTAPTVVSTALCITPTNYEAVAPKDGKFLCRECLTSKQNVDMLVEKLRHLVKSIASLIGYTSNGFSLHIVQNILNSLTEIMNIFDDFQSMPVISCLTIVQSKLVLFNVTMMFSIFRKVIDWILFFGNILTKIPLLNNQIIAFVRNFAQLAAHLVKNLNNSLANSSGCYDCKGIAIVNNEIAKVQNDILLFNKQFGQTIDSVPIFSVCDTQLVGAPITLCTSTIVGIVPVQTN